MKKTVITTLIISAVVLLLCSCRPANPTPSTKTGFYLDTVISVTLYEKDPDEYLEGCMALTRHYEDLFSDTVETSDISRINSSPEKRIDVDPDTAELLKIAGYYKEESSGAFDPCIGSLTKLWDFHEDSDKAIPSDSDRKAALISLKETSYSIEEEKGIYYVTLHGSGKLDLGGIAKGYIADRLKEYLNENGITEGIINLGGNVLTVGKKASGKNYRIGLQKPFSETGEVITSLDLSDSSVVTSGIYQRYFEKDGKIYHHILDTKTGCPVDNDLNSVTIISERSVDGDALSTYVFTLGLEDGKKYIESLPDTEAVFITKDNRIIETAGVRQN